MLAIFKRLLGARAVAGLFGLATTTFCAAMLPSSEYASASVSISYAAIFSVVCYLPFSKYILISGDPRPIEAIFWGVQPWIAAALFIIAFAAHKMIAVGSLGVVLSTVVFVVSQGWRDFTGELLRVRYHIETVQRLFILDATSTLMISIGAILVFRQAESMLLASAASSMFWSLFYLPRDMKKRVSSPYFKTLLEIYQYSVGVVGTNTLNAGLIASARTLLFKGSHADLVAAMQFLLDVLQKPMALVASSVNSTVIPLLRSKPLPFVLRSLLGIMVASLVGLIALACIVSLSSDALGFWSGSRIPFGIAIACAFFVWCNRYKTSVMDLSITVTPRYTTWLLLGGVVSFLLVMTMVGVEHGPQLTLAKAGAFILVGGSISVGVAKVAKAIQWHSVFAILALAAIAAVLMLAPLLPELFK